MEAVPVLHQLVREEIQETLWKWEILYRQDQILMDQLLLIMHPQ